LPYCSHKYILCQLKVWWHFSLSLLGRLLWYSNESWLIWMCTVIFWILLNNLLNKFTFYKWLIFCFCLDILFFTIYTLIELVRDFFPSVFILGRNQKWLFSACTSEFFLFLLQIFVKNFDVFKCHYFWGFLTILLIRFFENNKIWRWCWLGIFWIDQLFKTWL